MRRSTPARVPCRAVSSERIAVSVVIPTIGRPELLESCLESVAACRPQADEVLVVDQSHAPSVAAVVDRFAAAGARLIPCEGTGFARGTNLGVRSARNHVVLVTNDDCTVDADWVGAAHRLMAEEPEGILTGQVLPGTDPDRTPSTMVAAEALDYTGDVDLAHLFPGNMAVPRDGFLALGGFDERSSFAVASEDTDYCYRWIRAGGRMRYQPELVVWHHDWRTKDELIRRYVVYGQGEGAFIAKLLHAGDLYGFKVLVRDTKEWAKSIASMLIKGRKRWTDSRRGFLRGLPVGLWRGWRESRRLGRAPRAGSVSLAEILRET